MSKLAPHFLQTTPNINGWRAAGPVSMKHFGTWGAAQPDDGLTVGIRAQEPMDAKGFFDSGYGPEEAASARFNHHRPGYLADTNIAVWEFDNELNFETKTGRQWYSQYTIANMILFETIGKKAAIFSFSVGTPELDHWQDYLPALKYARDNGHYLALHEYMAPLADLGVGWNQLAWQEHLRDNPGADFEAWQVANPQQWWGRRLANGQPDEAYPYGWGVLRYRALYDTVLKPVGLNDLKLLITECGCDIISFTPPWWGQTGGWKANRDLWRSWGVDDVEAYFAEMLVWYDRQLQMDAYVKAAHIFTVGSTGVWADWDIANTGIETRILDHIANSSPPPPEPEPPAPPDETLHEWLWRLGGEIAPTNYDAALQKQIMEHDGWYPYGRERWQHYDEQQYAIQPAINWQSRERRVYFAPVPEWNNVQWIGDPALQINDIIDELPTHPDPLPENRYIERSLDDIQTIVFHHCAGSRRDRVRIDNIASFHVNTRGWERIGYHFCITEDGTIYQVNHLTTRSFHTGSRDGNGEGVGVALLGNFTNHPPSTAQLSSGQALRGHLRSVTGRTLVVKKHNDYVGTQCPGNSWPQWFGQLDDGVEPKPPPAKFQPGDRVQTTANLNVRDEPGGRLLGTQPLGSWGLVAKGPVQQGGYNWWLIDYDIAPEGWSVEQWLALATSEPPPPPPGEAIDLLPYFRGDGRQYEVQHPAPQNQSLFARIMTALTGGPTETFQTQRDGDVFYLVKNSQYEQFFADGLHIWRGLDTSPGPAPGYAERPGELRFYRQFEPGQQFAKWCKRHMAIGETYTGPGHNVQFFYKSDCAPSSANSGNSVNRVRLVAHHQSMTWNGILLQDVIEIGGVTADSERFWFARGFGLVAWSSQWGQSAISEIHSGRDDLRRETIGCL
jgi:hypothetical protein